MRIRRGTHRPRPHGLGALPRDALAAALEWAQARRGPGKKGVRIFWMQAGVVSPEAARLASEAGMDVVMNRCIYKETQRIRGAMATFRPA
ncbi:MAG: CoA-binding protein [Firmicutes bacterium]|nr:CoA-binding protein [Bacillota bacterium]